ncbi:MAG: hypothetical protein FJ224_09070 [Lentisphaerae bacterium]|nr:hypothetical protein [Lentisphaerota bacterium]
MDAANRPRVTLACLALTVAIAVQAEGQTDPVPGGHERRYASFSTPRRMGRLSCRSVNESSGLAPSRLTPGMFWTHNDSGGQPVLYAFLADGSEAGAMEIDGAKNRDWEDLASFVLKGKPFLLVADVGDNNAKREHCTLYVVPEPRSFGTNSILKCAPAMVITFRYPDGPRDCESVAVDATAGRVLMISKRDKPPVLYELDLAQAPSPHPVVARRLCQVSGIPEPGEYDFRTYGNWADFIWQPTALDISPDGMTALLLTYREACVYERRRADESWAETFSREPQFVRLPQLRGMEAACFGADGRSVFVTREGSDPPFYAISPTEP